MFGGIPPMCGRRRSFKLWHMLRSLPIALLHVGVLVAPARDAA